uniref:Uncharacterized protein LOC102805324 n=1 Tax=Saccoglossus kowalevskii TaxID=10224 RepID=A0ABM0MQH2_SACKO
MSKPALTHENWRNEIKKENKELEDSAANKPTVKKLNPAFLDRFECNKISETGSEQPHRESWSPIQGKNVSETEKKQLHNESWLPVQGKKVGEIEKKQPHRKSWLPVQGNKVNKTEQKQPHKESWLPIQGKKVSETEKKKSHREFWLPVQENKVTEIRKTEPLQRQTQFLEVLSSFQHDSVGDNKTIHQPIEKPVSEPRRPLSSFQEGLHETLVVRDRQQESIPVVKPKRPPQPVFQVKSKEAGQAVCVTSKVNKMDQMPPQKPKRTYAHDIYKEAKTLQTHNKNKTDKLQKFAPNAGEPTRIKLPPPTLPPPPPPHSRGDTHPPFRKVSSASSHNYECISDWVIDDISTFSNKFKRSRSSEDLRTATELDHHVKEHIYAEPDVTQPKKTHRTYSDPYEISHDRQTALVNEDVCGYAVPERLEDMQRRYAHSLKIRGSAKMSSGESRRSNSLEDGNSLLYDEKKIKNKLPWIQRKINEAFMVLKRKKEKKIRSNGNVVDGISQDDSVNSDNENDVSDADHRRRLRHAQTVKETAVYCTLDKIRETMRYKKMFDYVVIVELAQNRETCKHEPFISYQFPQE